MVVVLMAMMSNEFISYQSFSIDACTVHSAHSDCTPTLGCAAVWPRADVECSQGGRRVIDHGRGSGHWSVCAGPATLIPELTSSITTPRKKLSRQTTIALCVASHPSVTIRTLISAVCERGCMLRLSGPVQVGRNHAECGES